MTINEMGRDCSNQMTSDYLSDLYQNKTGPCEGAKSASKNTLYSIARTAARIGVIFLRFLNLFPAIIYCFVDGSPKPLGRALALLGLSIGRTPLGALQWAGTMIGSIMEGCGSTWGTKLILRMHEIDNYLDQLEGDLDPLDYHEGFASDSTRLHNELMYIKYTREEEPPTTELP